MSTTQTTYREKGVSLARGPALALGTFLVIAGLYFIYMEHGFPRLSSFPNSTVHIDGKAFFGGLRSQRLEWRADRGQRRPVDVRRSAAPSG